MPQVPGPRIPQFNLDSFLAMGPLGIEPHREINTRHGAHDVVRPQALAR